MAKLKKIKNGKIKRHKFRKQLGIKQGFGRPWSAESVMFRVEFNWENEDGTEENEQVHWIECRKFKDRERQDLVAYYKSSKDGWSERESLESKFVCVHVSQLLAKNKDKHHINQAFIYAAPKKGNETIRYPIYIIKWSENLAQSIVNNLNINIVLKNSIYPYHFQCKN